MLINIEGITGRYKNQESQGRYKKLRKPKAY